MDPFLQLGAQDEAAYTHGAIRMALQGDWLNPMLLGRYVFEKPPLLIWLSGISMKILGIGSFTARLPAVLAGASILTICFAVGWGTRSAVAGAAAALLCLSNQLLFTMSRHNMTDIVLAATTLIGLSALIRDPALTRRGPCVLFVLAIASGVLTKSIAGVLPAIAALVFAAAASRRPLTRLRRIALLTGAALLLASPWFVYQMMVHRQWFEADVYFQIIKVGVESSRSSMFGRIQFYLWRFLNAGPLTLLLSISALPALINDSRRRDPVALVLLCFLAVLTAALLCFRFESETYLAPLIPVAIVIAAARSPLLARRSALPVCGLIVIAFIVKAAHPSQPWGISYGRGSTVPASAVLASYCEERRGNVLYILDVQDQFYALALPLAHVRYGWLDPSGEIPKVRPHLAYLGIVQDAAATSQTGLYAARLRDWGLNNPEPLGTAITGKSIQDLVALVLGHPESDFLVSPALAAALRDRQPHETHYYGTCCVLLQSRVSHPAAPAGWTCRM
ncbi:MAG: glycosyltransferase family 39 protein [Acidobacteriota bacterium]|nr:glycosyltransferase family 39 protein [Acidobacteriota bacterium]